METWLMISDITGRQYPYKVTDNGISVSGIIITETNYNLDSIQDLLESEITIRVGNRIFMTEKLVELSVIQHPIGAS